MKRNPNAKTHISAAAVLSASALLVSGSPAQAQAQAQAPKVAPPVQKLPVAAPIAPAGPKGVPENRASLAPVMKFAAVFPKYGSTLTAAGMLNGRPVFKTAQGEFFQVDPQTGNLKFHTAASLGYLKMDDWERKTSAKGAPFIKLKGEQRVSVLGVDAQGHVVQKNSRGENFFLNAYGDMVFIK